MGEASVLAVSGNVAEKTAQGGSFTKNVVAFHAGSVCLIKMCKYKSFHRLNLHSLLKRWTILARVDAGCIMIASVGIAVVCLIAMLYAYKDNDARSNTPFPIRNAAFIGHESAGERLSTAGNIAPVRTVSLARIRASAHTKLAS